MFSEFDYKKMIINLKKMKTIILLFSLSFMINPIFAITGNRYSTVEKIYKHRNYENNIATDDTLSLVGQILKMPFISKNGKEIPGVFDYFFKVGKKKYFIKISESALSAEKLEELMIRDQRPEAEYHNRRFEVIIKNGEWDTDPANPEDIQSRLGEYIAIIRELRID
jgi:hypothetical protein